MACLFCQIIKKQIPAQKVFESDMAIVIKDIQPKAPIHLLIIPKKHLSSISALREKDEALVGKLVLIAQKLAKKLKVEKEGYRLIFNVGKNAGQTISHLHLHFLAGKKLPFV